MLSGSSRETEGFKWLSEEWRESDDAPRLNAGNEIQIK
jgi:hypothetical protein